MHKQCRAWTTQLHTPIAVPAPFPSEKREFLRPWERRKSTSLRGMMVQKTPWLGVSHCWGVRAERKATSSRGDEVGVSEEPSLSAGSGRAVQTGWTIGTVWRGWQSLCSKWSWIIWTAALWMGKEIGQSTERLTGRTGSTWGVIVLHIGLKSGGMRL